MWVKGVPYVFIKAENKFWKRKQVLEQDLPAGPNTEQVYKA